MKIIIAPNALKGCLSAYDAAKAIEQGVLHVLPDAETICLPIADGGDGFLDVYIQILDAQRIQQQVTGPLGKPVQADFLYCPEKKLAVIELALASGLALLKPHEYNVNRASTIGVGELIHYALSMDVRRIILGIGGSASNEVAMGIATALGIKFLDSHHHILSPCANNLLKVEKIDVTELDEKVKNVTFEIVCDVKNPMLGHDGAAAVFASQKGASKEDIVTLEKGLSHFADVLEKTYSLNVRKILSGGAAGGVGAGMYAMFNARLCIGTDIIFDLLGLKKKLVNADLLITAEGKLDAQSQYGKAPSAAALLAKKFNVPTYIIAGQVDAGNYLEFKKVFSLTSKNCSREYAMNNVQNLLRDITEGFIRELS